MTDFILIIAGVSGVGKTTVASELAIRNPSFKMSRSHTTRAKRGDGRDSEYIYVTEEEFSSLIAKGEMLEYTKYSGTLYGTSKREIYSILDAGNIPLLVLDYNGVRSFKAHSLPYPVICVYLYASLDTARERLVSRNKSSLSQGDAKAASDKRHLVNIEDYLDIKSRIDSFDFLVENSNLDGAVEEILSILSNIDKVRSQPVEYKLGIAEKLYADALKSKDFD